MSILACNPEGHIAAVVAGVDVPGAAEAIAAVIAAMASSHFTQSSFLVPSCGMHKQPTWAVATLTTERGAHTAVSRCSKAKARTKCAECAGVVGHRPVRSTFGQGEGSLRGCRVRTERGGDESLDQLRIAWVECGLEVPGTAVVPGCSHVLPRRC